MGTSRRQYTDEFKREAVGLLASSGRPSSQIARAQVIALEKAKTEKEAHGPSSRANAPATAAPRTLSTPAT
ncbi:MAG: transposase [Methylocella sp.]